MKNLKKVLGSLVLLAVLLSPFYARAQETEPTEPPVITEEENIAEAEPEALAPLQLDISVEVPATCEVEDSNNEKHTYTATSGDSYLAICAIQAALDDGLLGSAEFSNQFPSMGLFITSMNGVTADPSSQYWSLYYNNDYTDLGISTLPISSSDEITLKLLDFSGNEIGDFVIIHINYLIPVTNDQPESRGSSGGSSRDKNDKKKNPEVLGAETSPLFDINKAYAFLLSQQKENGSFGEEIYTDWVTIALASNDTQTYKIAPIARLVKYLSLNKPAGTNLTDYERHAMALMALGLDPHDVNGENYIQKIVTSFDGKQFGDTNEDNDDIFALIVLLNAGYGKEEKMIQDSLTFILGRQRTNGSWDESIDMTGAGLQALSMFSDENPIKASISQAKEFLKTTQKENGSWGDHASSTAWALGGVYALQEKIEAWEAPDGNPVSFLATLQGEDGGIKDEVIENRIWKTAYAVTALSSKSWDQTLQNFDKKEIGLVTQTIPIQKKNVPIPKASEKKIESPKSQNALPTIETPEANPVAKAIQPAKTKTPQTDKNWFAKFLGIFGWN